MIQYNIIFIVMQCKYNREVGSLFCHQGVLGLSERKEARHPNDDS